MRYIPYPPYWTSDDDTTEMTPLGALCVFIGIILLGMLAYCTEQYREQKIISWAQGQEISQVELSASSWSDNNPIPTHKGVSTYTLHGLQNDQKVTYWVADNPWRYSKANPDGSAGPIQEFTP